GFTVANPALFILAPSRYLSSPVAGLTLLYGKAFLLTEGGSARRASWHGVFAASIACFASNLPDSNAIYWMIAVSGQVRLLRPQILQARRRAARCLLL